MSYEKHPGSKEPDHDYAWIESLMQPGQDSPEAVSVPMHEHYFNLLIALDMLALASTRKGMTAAMTYEEYRGDIEQRYGVGAPDIVAGAYRNGTIAERFARECFEIACGDAGPAEPDFAKNEWEKFSSLYAGAHDNSERRDKEREKYKEICAVLKSVVDTDE